MKNLLSLLLISICSSCSYSQKKMEPQTPRSPAAQSKSGFAVVELFTSEGCSSCPPADVLLPKLKEQYGDKLFILSFHVDYWNRLGWKDPFSSAEWSARQSRYAAAFKSENVYTPQAVVNGKAHITGSNRSGLEKLIAAELDGSKARDIELSATSDNSKSITVTCNAKLQSGEVLNIALVQLNASTSVGAGENGGRRLQHSSVVRDLKTVRDGEGTAQMTLPDDLPASDFHIIAYAQHERTMRTAGAAEVAIGTK